MCQNIGSVAASVEPGCSVNIGVTASGYDISSNSDDGVLTAVTIMKELVRNITDAVSSQ